MAGQDTVELLSHVLTAVSICNLLSGIPGSISMWKTGKTDGWPVLFFTIGLVGAAGMIHYGIIMDNFTLIFINGLQFAACLYYVLSYVILVRQKAQSARLVLMAIVYVTGLYGYATYKGLAMDQIANLLGSSSGLVFFVMNASTILDVVNAHGSRKADFDVLMLSAGLLNAALWFMYGWLLEDVYIYVPSIPFLLTGPIKFLQMMIYGQAHKKPTKKTE